MVNADYAQAASPGEENSVTRNVYWQISSLFSAVRNQRSLGNFPGFTTKLLFPSSILKEAAGAMPGVM